MWHGLLIGMGIHNLDHPMNHLSLRKRGTLEKSLRNALTKICIHPDFYDSLVVDSNQIFMNLEWTNLLKQKPKTFKCLGVEVKNVSERYFFNSA